MSEQKPDQPITDEAEGLNLDLADVTSDATATPQPAQPAPAAAAPAPTPAPQPAPAHTTAASSQRQRASQLAQALRQELQKAVVGQLQVIDDVLTALLAGGHVLVEGVPGLGKTLLVRALARCFGGEFSRIQFTPT